MHTCIRTHAQCVCMHVGKYVGMNVYVYVYTISILSLYVRSFCEFSPHQGFPWCKNVSQGKYDYCKASMYVYVVTCVHACVYLGMDVCLCMCLCMVKWMHSVYGYAYPIYSGILLENKFLQTSIDILLQTGMDSTNVYAYISIIALLFCIPPAIVVRFFMLH